jgi:hypothetical protein
MITLQKVTSNVQSVPRPSPGRQGQGDIRLTLTPSVIPNSNYVIMLKLFKIFLRLFAPYSSGAQGLFDHPVSSAKVKNEWSYTSASRE